MITPRFTISQTETNVQINIRTPSIRSASGTLEFDIAGNLFTFYLAPYYLRLKLPGELLAESDADAVEDETLKPQMRYDAGACEVQISAVKKNRGEEFKDLDLVSKMLAREDPSSKLSNNGPLIQEMDVNTEGLNDDRVHEIQKEGEMFNWEIEQNINVNDEESANELRTSAGYGFNRAHSGDLGVAIAAGAAEVNEYPDPEHSVPGERSAFREQLEAMAFDPDYYLADTYDNPDISEYLRYSPTARSSEEVIFTDKEQLTMSTKLPRKSVYILNDPRRTYIGLIGFLFGVCYDIRTTMADPTVESAWTVCKLNPLIAALDDDFSSVQTILVSCVVRSLSFPLFRTWSLAEAVVEDVYCALRSGRRMVLRLLLEYRSRVETGSAGGDGAYGVYNRIWIDEYCGWIQTASDEVLRSLAHEIHRNPVTKDILPGIDLVALEEAAEEAIAEQTEQSSDANTSGHP